MKPRHAPCPRLLRTERFPTLVRVTDRLHELRRQRELLQQHLDWLDAEIAAEALTDPTKVALVDRPRFTPSASVAHPAPPSTAPDPDTILQKFGSDLQQAPARAKLGCWVVFFSAFALLGLTVATWFVLRGR
ncbi:MAG: hypothetical protein C0518_07205 [Opitutus sp.]|nr:hypothetical protein [Opitutus sp.]